MDLAQIGRALGQTGSLAHSPGNGYENAGQNGDHGNNRQELDQGERT
jgi:hypothetical protein